MLPLTPPVSVPAVHKSTADAHSAPVTTVEVKCPDTERVPAAQTVAADDYQHGHGNSRSDRRSVAATSAN